MAGEGVGCRGQSTGPSPGRRCPNMGCLAISKAMGEAAQPQI